MESNEVLDRLPRHLMSLVIEQPYNSYTAQDHAVWRYVMRQNVRYLPHVAHQSYLEGLKRTGIGVDRIPHMYGMNRILKEIGWAAVAVDGFIPPAAFMEFQAYNVLVIAADIRPATQIMYTPAPDIIHEAAGHAPIIADQEYAAYLRDFGRTGSLAFSSIYDDQLYEAIRHLSILKADPYSNSESIIRAEEELDALTKISSGPSEMALLRNLHWWTVEYGLIGELNRPKIYGAGLLSSIGESYSCLQDHVRKLPYTLDARFVNFDITTQQPQLFVTPDFEHLQSVLKEFESSLAFHNGGLVGIHKAIHSGSVSTLVFASGIQASGVVTDVIGWNGRPAYVSFKGPVQLGFNNRQLEGHGKDYHAQGFGSPVGKLKGIETPPERFAAVQLDALGIASGKPVTLEFESGVIVKGVVKSVTRQADKNILISFTDCTVIYRDQLLFHPSWGIYDMAIGSEITSCYSGPAEPDAYGFEFPVPKEKTHKIEHSKYALALHEHYSAVRKIREDGGDLTQLCQIADDLILNFPEDWLLPLEIHEVLESVNDPSEARNKILRHLKKKAIDDDSLLKLIQDGLAAEKS